MMLKLMPHNQKLRVGTATAVLTVMQQNNEPRPRNTNARPSLNNDTANVRSGEIVQGKYDYEVLRRLGSGSNGITYAANTLSGPQTGEEVAIKVLSLRGSRDWKAVELFEREAKTLAQLDHPGIPQYIDYFEVDTSSDRCFYIVQKLAPGDALQDMVDGGWRPQEEEAVRITLSLLDILGYLGSMRPPVVHRDIKPANIIVDGKGGQVSLVDFGAVAAANPTQRMGSTIIGTYGYMSPEQFRGEVTPVTDLYGVGACLLFLLTGQSPSEFPQTRLKVDVSSVVASPRVKAVLERLLEPLPEDRLQSAKQAADALLGNASPASIASAVRDGGRFRQPAGSKVVLAREGNSRLLVQVPPRGFTGETVMAGSFALVWNAFVGVWTIGALGAGPLFAAFSTPFWVAGYQLVVSGVLPAFEDAMMEIDPTKFRIKSSVLGKDKFIEGYTADLQGVRVHTSMVVNNEPQNVIQLSEGVRNYEFGTGLSYVEQQWLVQEIKAFLEEAPIMPAP